MNPDYDITHVYAPYVSTLIWRMIGANVKNDDRNGTVIDTDVNEFMGTCAEKGVLMLTPDQYEVK